LVIALVLAFGMLYLTLRRRHPLIASANPRTRLANGRPGM
jgi:hypothetical protein